MLECVSRAERVVRASRNYTGWIKVRNDKTWNFLLFVATILFFTRLTKTEGLSLGASLVCAGTSGLTDKQRAMCRASPAAIAAIGDGLRMAYAECRAQLAGARWNCSGVGEGNIFGHVMPLATREAAFTYAITAAGVTHALSTACFRGDLPMCSCRAVNRRRLPANDQFQWAGCGEPAYGGRFARRFLDARELEEDARSACNKHNNRVGRKMVKDLFRKDCKCHGVSGSCAMKTCWPALPTFKEVAAKLKERYVRAKMVAKPNTHLVIKRSNLKAGMGRQPRKSDLVFLDVSPPYCDPDPQAGVLGTQGRHCNRTSRGENGCATLCCDRGYSTVPITKREQCHCKFKWCCSVSCKTCSRTTDTHICN